MHEKRKSNTIKILVNKKYKFCLTLAKTSDQFFSVFFLTYIPESFVHPPRIPSKRHYQRLLHESYQVRAKGRGNPVKKSVLKIKV